MVIWLISTPTSLNIELFKILKLSSGSFFNLAKNLKKEGIPDVLEMVNKMGFEKKIVNTPASLGGKEGENMEIYIKKFNIK